MCQNPSVRFRVEAVLPAHGIVACRRLEPADFAIATATLNGCRVAHAEVPRALRPDGSLDLDCFAFTLARRDDAAKFVVGEEAELAKAPTG